MRIGDLIAHIKTSKINISSLKQYLRKKMSWGWIIVVILGFLPVLLVFFTGNRNQQQQQQQQEQQQQTGNASSNKKRKGNKQYVYSGWKIVVSADSFMSIPPPSSSISQEPSTTTTTTINRTQLSLIQKLAQECDLFIVAQVNTDDQERSVIECIKRKGDEQVGDKSLCDYGLNEHKVLFCSTARGQIAIARQLEPDLFVGTDSGVTSELTRFLPNVSLIKMDNVTTTPVDGTTTFSSLNSLFGSLDHK